MAKKKTKTKKKTKKQEEYNEKPAFRILPYILLIIGIVLIYARYIEPKNIKIKDYSITDSGLPESFDGFSVVHFSDLKLGSTITVDDLDSIVEKINKLKPDVVVFTGDLIDKEVKLSLKEKEAVTKKLGSIDPLLGKYSVKGDMDENNAIYDYVITYSGFTDISNNYELIYFKGLTPIVMYGLGSLNKKDQDYTKAFAYPDEKEDPKYMATYRILLAHEPDTIEKVKNYNISLMLSGHSLNSSINIPFIKNNYNIKGASTYYDDEYNVGQTKLYVSSGLGTNKYHLRINSRPSISVYRLYTK